MTLVQVIALFLLAATVGAVLLFASMMVGSRNRKLSDRLGTIGIAVFGAGMLVFMLYFVVYLLATPMDLSYGSDV